MNDHEFKEHTEKLVQEIRPIFAKMREEIQAQNDEYFKNSTLRKLADKYKAQKLPPL